MLSSPSADKRALPVSHTSHSFIFCRGLFFVCCRSLCFLYLFYRFRGVLHCVRTTIYLDFTSLKIQKSTRQSFKLMGGFSQFPLCMLRFLYRLLSFRFAAFRKASPISVMQSRVTTRNAPGITMIHQAPPDIAFSAKLSMLPQEIISSGRPIPM